jgi:hypothetical protein
MRKATAYRPRCHPQPCRPRRGNAPAPMAGPAGQQPRPERDSLTRPVVPVLRMMQEADVKRDASKINIVHHLDTSAHLAPHPSPSLRGR